LFVTAGIAEIDFAVVDDRVRPVRDVERAVGAHLDGDRTEGHVARADDVRQLLGDVAGLRGFAGAEIVEAEADDAMRAEIARDRVALPVGAEQRALDQFEAAELRVGAGADAADETTGTFGSMSESVAMTLAIFWSMPAISGEWKAWLTSSLVLLSPAAVIAAAAASMPGVVPETTVCVGWLWLATTTPGTVKSAFSTTVRSAITASIAPLSVRPSSFMS
jgi:hypothetical protein